MWRARAIVKSSPTLDRIFTLEEVYSAISIVPPLGTEGFIFLAWSWGKRAIAANLLSRAPQLADELRLSLIQIKAKGRGLRLA